jgi:hypothetical protein
MPTDNSTPIRPATDAQKPAMRPAFPLLDRVSAATPSGSKRSAPAFRIYSPQSIWEWTPQGNCRPHDRKGENVCSTMLYGSRGVSVIRRRSAPRRTNVNPYSALPSDCHPSASSRSIAAVMTDLTRVLPTRQPGIGGDRCHYSQKRAPTGKRPKALSG